MKQFPHTVFNISITCATQKRRGLPNTELHICTIHFFFLITSAITVPFAAGDGAFL